MPDSIINIVEALNNIRVAAAGEKAIDGAKSIGLITSKGYERLTALLKDFIEKEKKNPTKELPYCLQQLQLVLELIPYMKKFSIETDTIVNKLLDLEKKSRLNANPFKQN